MSSSWSKGKTKNTDSSVMKISETMKSRKLDNFRDWRSVMKKQGLIKSNYPKLKKDVHLAELIGVILGDGHIRKYPRTEELSIFSNSNNKGFVNRYANLINIVFDKKPKISNHSGKKCTRIRIYEKYISERLDVPFSPRAKLVFKIPDWILDKKKYIVCYLRGLYEAEGSHNIHLPTSTYKVHFSNRNISILDNVFILVKKLGFHPHRSLYSIQLSRKEEVFKFIDLIKFRQY